jgi:outer membrane biosynthesis protein TonB
MRACTTANAILLGVVLAAATFAACASSGTQTPPPGDPNATDPNADPAAASAATEGSPDTTEAAPQAPPKKQPETVADCKELQSDITNEPPPNAVPMNNATAPLDGGVSTRLQPMVDIMRANRDKFRCCFDLWARKNPGASGRIMLRVKLKPDGAVVTSEVVQKDSTVTAPEVHACVAEVARSLTYPASPNGKETTYTHPFDFKARH